MDSCFLLLYNFTFWKRHGRNGICVFKELHDKGLEQPLQNYLALGFVTEFQVFVKFTRFLCVQAAQIRISQSNIPKLNSNYPNLIEL